MQTAGPARRTGRALALAGGLGGSLGAAALVALARRRNIHLWLPAYLGQQLRPAPSVAGATRHLLFCFVDHFEPQCQRPDRSLEDERVEDWCRSYPELTRGLQDADGRPPIHTFFYPAEEYRPEHIERLVELCRAGLGEVEVHLHHDGDTADSLRAQLREFVDVLADRHDALPRDPAGNPLWAFIHGNWTLDNSSPDGRFCGVNDELTLLGEEGCYADFTLPSAPSATQTRIINSIYYAAGTRGRPKSHDRGEPLRVGGPRRDGPVLIQGPLGFMRHSRKLGILPRIENGDVRAGQPPVPPRIDDWVRAGVHVRGRPEWTFVKIHTHGVQESDRPTLLGPSMRTAFDYLHDRYNDGRRWKLHYVSAREMYNLARAAEAGEPGDPGQYRDYEVPRPLYRPMSS